MSLILTCSTCSKAKKTKAKPVKEEPAPAPVVEDDLDMEDDIDDLDEVVEPIMDIAEMKTEIRNRNKAGTAEQKAAVKAIINATGKKLNDIDDEDLLKEMLAVFE
jgi:hypothetical protein